MKKLHENVSARCSSKPDSQVSNVENPTDKEILVPNTPKSKTKQILAEAGLLNKAQSSKISKHLLLSNVLQVQAETDLLRCISWISRLIDPLKIDLRRNGQQINMTQQK